MEHIVQFAVSVDDDRIQKIMEESAVKQITDDIKTFSHGKSFYGDRLNNTPEKLAEIFREEIAKYVKDNADKVIDKAVEEVAKRMMATKKVKDAVNSVVGESDNE